MDRDLPTSPDSNRQDPPAPARVKVAQARSEVESASLPQETASTESPPEPQRLALPDYIVEKTKGNPDAKLWNRFSKTITTAVLSETPPFPRSMLIEVANICNHRCSFCAYPKMTRPSQVINPELFESIVRQAYELGAREIGLHGGSEPLTCKKLDSFIKLCHDIGYEYIYFTTNGSLADEARFKRLIDAGVDSIKFSINAGDRDTYLKIHGKDNFEKVLGNLEFVSRYRATLGRKLYLAVSFVEVPENAASFPALKARVENLVDEVFHVHAANQSGQMLNLPVSPYMPETCQVPFNQANITREGYLRACCNDYQNMLAIEDLNQVSLAEAWQGARFRDLRQRHLQGRLEGTLCHNCIKGCQDKIEPINRKLGDWGMLK